MYISRIHIQNFRNYKDFTMDFHKGLNVIIGSNNSGKTGQSLILCKPQNWLQNDNII